MKARILDRADVLKIVDLLRQQGYEVVAPFCGHGRDTYFDAVTDQNRDQIQTHFANPYYPPKRYVLPHIEPLLKITRTDGNVRIEPTYEEPKRAVFGIRSCDVAGIYHLDLFYLGGSFATSTTKSTGRTSSWSTWSARIRTATSVTSASAFAPTLALPLAAVLICN